jgi:glutathionylspermidine amidase/synthetase
MSLFLLFFLLVALVVFVVVLEYEPRKCGQTRGVISYYNSSGNYQPPNFYHGQYTGLKWECVEFARRYLIATRNLTFPSVENALSMMNIPYITPVYRNDHKIPVVFRSSKSEMSPKEGDIIFFHDRFTGHVGVVTAINGDQIYVASQNGTPQEWEGDDYWQTFNRADNKIIGWWEL